MNPKNPYQSDYDFDRLMRHYPKLKTHVILNPSGKETIDFSNADAVYELNKALLLTDFKLEAYNLPRGYLIPPVPGRLDYLLHVQDILVKIINPSSSTKIRGLDIGCGANGIYCILGAQYFNWYMVGIESDANAVDVAKANLNSTLSLQQKINIRYQDNKSFILKNSILPDEQFDFTVCNPPFHSSEAEAYKGSMRKYHNLKLNNGLLNFEGQANELWCNGGEALFIKRLIKESILFKDRVKIFTSLVAKASHLPKIEKQLKKSKAVYEIVPMAQGNKKSRFIMWWF